MQIQWHGLGCFTISGKPSVGEVRVVTDPFGPKADKKTPRSLKGVMAISSHDGEMAKHIETDSGPEETSKPFAVVHAGEYEVQGVFATGIHAPLKDKTMHTIYLIRMEGMRIAFLGALDRKLTDKEIEALGEVHILIIPVGGDAVLKADEAAEVVNQVEPRMVIPSYYGSGEMTDEKGFCKEVACPVEESPKLKIQKSGLPTDDMQMVVLKRS